MNNNKRILAIVPARSGSKGLPHKNVRNFCGKPLLAWSIQSALDNSYIDYVCLSTDSEEYAAIGADIGAHIPFLRSPELSCDTASSIDVLLDAIDQLSFQGEDFDVVTLLEPTSPLRSDDSICKALDIVCSGRHSAAVSVCLAEKEHPAYMYSISSTDQTLVPFLSGFPTDLRRQDLEPVYFLDGNIYASTISSLQKNRTFYHGDTAPVISSVESSIEIDSELDFMMAEAVYTKLFSNPL